MTVADKIADELLRTNFWNWNSKGGDWVLKMGTSTFVVCRTQTGFTLSVNNILVKPTKSRQFALGRMLAEYDKENRSRDLKHALRDLQREREKNNG